jgi:hypothetical protein
MRQSKRNIQSGAQRVASTCEHANISINSNRVEICKQNIKKCSIMMFNDFQTLPLGMQAQTLLLGMQAQTFLLGMQAQTFNVLFNSLH